MNSKLETIAKILGLTLSKEENVELSADGKLQDGTVIKTTSDAFVVGAVVTVPDENGVYGAPEPGTLTMQDGSEIVVDANGTITDVKPAEAATGNEPGTPQGMTEELNDEPANEPFALSEETYNQLLERISKLEDMLLASVEKLSETNKDLNEKVEQLSAQPAAEPIKKRIPVVEENALAGLKLPKK